MIIGSVKTRSHNANILQNFFDWSTIDHDERKNEEKLIGTHKKFFFFFYYR